MEKVWRRVGLHSSRKKRDGNDASQPGSSSNLSVPREAEYQNIHTLRTADFLRQHHRLNEDKSTLRSSYIIRNGDNLVLVERRRRRRRRSGARASSGSRHAAAAAEETARTEQKRRPPARLKIFGIQWPLHSSDSRPSIARRLCRGRRSKDENELYRSNSFKFERFERERPVDDSVSLLAGSQAALCADYSVPVDCVGAAGPAPRPSSFHEVSAPKVEFLEAYCAPRDTSRRRSPQHKRRARDSARRSPDERFATDTRGRCRSDRRRFEPPSFEKRAFENSIDADSARRRADYESARRTDFDLSLPGRSRRSPESGPEGSPGSPPEPAPSAPPLQEYQARRYNRSYFRSESSSEGPSSSPSDEELDAYDASGAAPSLHSPESGRSHPNQPRRNPSPYYYGDLFRTQDPAAAPQTPSSSSQPSTTHAPRYRKSASLDAPHVAARPTLPKRFSVAEDGFRELERSSSSSSGSRAAGWMPPRRRAPDAPACVCAAPDHVDEPHSSRSVFYVPAPLPRWPPEMTAHRVYETAFDCNVQRSDDDLDHFERVTNHPALLDHDRSLVSSTSSAFDAVERGDPDRKGRRKVTMKTDSVRRSKIPTIRQKRETETTASTLSEELEKVHLENEERTASTSLLPLCLFTPTPPATAPLPTKFQQPTKDYVAMNSIKSAPNLPAQPAHPRLKDLRLPVKSLRARETPTSSDVSLAEAVQQPAGSTEIDPAQRLHDSGHEEEDERTQSKTGIFLEIKGRPTSDSDTPESSRRGPEGVGPILEFKGRPPVARPNRKYSSTESMATSSSGGSMESIGSSTSEERSTTSSDGRRRASSTTLSSHSSDSGAFPGSGKHKPLGFHHHSAKLHILSPISDKSSLEPASETSDNNKNNNSQKVSPEEGDTSAEPSTVFKPKRRVPQNRNLLSLAFQHSHGEAGSDSGISIHSREGSNSRNAFVGFNQEDKEKNCSQDLSDLPFDMPKLRRRRQQSAEAEDLRSLPFDMPKLRRKLRGQSLHLGDFGEISQASSSQSMNEDNQGKHRAKLTLNFEKPSGPGGCGGAARVLQLNLGGLAPPPRDLVDATVPLDRQGWYHGTISRVEAENVLRDAEEGAFLVRTSQSGKHDYSLSLKSVRGFMHLRICKSAEGFTLGGASGAGCAFPTVPALLRHYAAAQRLPVRGAEHMSLATPLAAVLL